MKSTPPKILWIDCIGALIAGVLVLACSKWLSIWDGIPQSVVVFMGVMNLIYGAYSIFVTTRRSRTIGLVGFLAFANMSWLTVCLAITISWWNDITVFGLIHVLGEGCYVAALGLTEWRWREKLVVTC